MAVGNPAGGALNARAPVEAYLTTPAGRRKVFSSTSNPANEKCHNSVMIQSLQTWTLALLQQTFLPISPSQLPSFLIKDHSSLLYQPMVWHSLHVPSCNSSAIPEETHFVYSIFKVDKANKRNQGSSIFHSQENHLLYDKKRRVHLCHQLKTPNGNIY